MDGVEQACAASTVLLEAGGDKDAPCNKGCTPLSIEANSGQLEAVCFLIKNGADKHMAAKNGITPLYAAASNNYTEIGRFFVQHGADKNKSADERATPLKTWQPTTAILGSCSILD